MSNQQEFCIDINDLKAKPKKSNQQLLNNVDKAGDAHGFMPRSARRRPGRKLSLRTGQVHARVLPAVTRAIATEARRRGVQQGVLIEEAWALYKKSQSA